jgi:uncharacterized protein YbbK (DUF523 family)
MGNFMEKYKLLVSSCLLGEDVKYNGGNNLLSKVSLEKLKNKFELFSFCPEVAGGLPIPRIPCEITCENPLKIINKNNIDKTENFIMGANKTLGLCKKEDIKLALLKENSPSCSNTFIYDGTFSSTKIEGFGATVKLLIDNKIIIFNENQIEELLNL